MTVETDRRDSKRRADDALTFQLMQETRTMVKEIEEAMDAKFDSLTSEIHTQSKRIEQISASTIALITEQSRLIKEMSAKVSAGFPGGDADSHRHAHEQWIAKNRKEEEFWLDIKKKAVGSAVTAIILWVGFVLWNAFLQGPK